LSASQVNATIARKPSCQVPAKQINTESPLFLQLSVKTRPGCRHSRRQMQTPTVAQSLLHCQTMSVTLSSPQRLPAKAEP